MAGLSDVAYTFGSDATDGGCSAFTHAGISSAQDYPTRPITVVVPFAAGGPTDILARLFGQSLGQTLGQPS